MSDHNRRAGVEEKISQAQPENAEHRGMVAYISSAPAETAIEAIIDDPARWKETSDGIFIYKDPKTGTYVSMGDPRSAFPLEQREIAWNKILALDDQTAQTFLYVMTRDLSEPGSGRKVRIHVNDILQFKGFSRHRKGDFRPEQKRAEQSRLLLLSDMWAAVDDEIDVRAGRGWRKKRVKLFSRLVELEIEAEADAQQPPVTSAMPMLLPDILPENAVPYAFRVALGGWAEPYRTVSTYVREVLARIVQYDASRETERFAMRIALCLMFGESSNKESWRLSELLERARIELPTHHADRFREILENAFDLLQRDGLISSWSYIGDGELPRKRWLQKWLQWNIVFGKPHLSVSAGQQGTGEVVAT